MVRTGVNVPVVGKILCEVKPVSLVSSEQSGNQSNPEPNCRMNYILT